jgi:hypothetical protein
MAYANQPAVLSVAEAEAFTVLALRYLESACTVEEIEQLKQTLTGSVRHRALFVRVCRLQGNLYEAFAARRAELRQKSVSSAESLLASAMAGEGTTAGKQGPRAGPFERVAGQESPGVGNDLSLRHDLTADPVGADPSADTVVRELSGEDTIHPPSKTPGQ